MFLLYYANSNRRFVNFVAIFGLTFIYLLFLSNNGYVDAKFSLPARLYKYSI